MNDDLKKQLRRAREMMAKANEETNKTKKEKSLRKASPFHQGMIITAEDIEKARISMESMEQKKRREERAKEEKDRDIIKEKISKIKKETIKEEERVKKEAKEEISKKLQAEKEAEKIKLMKFSETKKKQQKIIEQKHPDNLPKITTLRSDFLKTYNPETSSLANIVTQSTPAEKNFWREKQSKQKDKFSLIKIITILILLLGITSSSYFLFNWWKTMKKNRIPLAEKDLIITDNSLDLKIYDSTPQENLITLQNTIRQMANHEKITSIRFINKRINPKNNKNYLYEIGINEINLLKIEPQEDFLYFLKNNFMMGIYEKNKDNQIFYLFETRSFASTFNQMIKDGQEIMQTLFLAFYNEENINKVKTGIFYDDYLANINVRILVNDNNVYAVYGWLNEETLLITSNRESFIKIVNTWRSS